MPADIFQNFEQLSRQLKRGEDYDFKAIRQASPVAIIVPHGGKIEPGTSEIATAIATDMYNLYCFEGLKRRPHHEIHVTSHKFDEPNCVAIVASCDFVVAVHGRADGDDGKTIFLGGLDTGLRDAIYVRLADGNFAAETGGHKFSATHPENICNRGRRRMGAQLELPRSLRNKLKADEKLLDRFANLVRDAIADCSAKPSAE